MTKLKFKRYDSAEYLEMEEDIAAYLEAAMELGNDDPAYITRVLATIARARNIAKLAERAGMSRQGLYKVLSPEGKPSFATVAKLAKALDLKLHLTPKTPTPESEVA